MMDKLVVSGSPHIHANEDTPRIMRWVVIALLPSIAISLYMFGWNALIVYLVAVLSAMLFEYLIQKFLIKGPNTLYDWSAVVTGVLLAMNVPSNIPIWMLLVGSLVAIGIGKMSFGGLGKNPFNPALVGRVFMLISFPVAMTSWPKPIESASMLTDVVTGPTPLGIVKEELKKGMTIDQIMASGQVPDYVSMLWGNMGGSVGEISALMIIIGGLILLFKKIITWHIPVAYILTSFVFAGVLYLIDPQHYVDPFFHMVTGGLMLGAWFMATDMVTSPMSNWGKIIFGIGCGFLTILIRVFGAYPEGVSFAILIMNAFVPYLDKIRPRRFGKEVKS
ncbi:MAG: RnfABCDGE type electron transport complex subunit D [Bacteroidales bacterium]|nr:RnfABCDGE type electron transport complex subunit D [Bacteroidales bacterium]